MEGRILAWRNDNEELAFELKLKNFNLAKFQVEFGLSLGNPMYDVYVVKPSNAPFLARYLECPHAWNFEAYEYHLER